MSGRGAALCARLSGGREHYETYCELNDGLNRTVWVTTLCIYALVMACHVGRMAASDKVRLFVAIFGAGRRAEAKFKSQSTRRWP